MRPEAKTSHLNNSTSIGLFQGFLITHVDRIEIHEGNQKFRLNWFWIQNHLLGLL